MKLINFLQLFFYNVLNFLYLGKILINFSINGGIKMDISKYIWCFVIGGIICMIVQILIDKTKLTSARILVLFVTAGAILTGLGIYQHVVDLGGSGATVPLTGFGYSLAKGTMKAVDESGFIGIFTGGIKATAGGVGAAILFGFIAALVSKPKIKS